MEPINILPKSLGTARRKEGEDDYATLLKLTAEIMLPSEAQVSRLFQANRNRQPFWLGDAAQRQICCHVSTMRCRRTDKSEIVTVTLVIEEPPLREVMDLFVMVRDQVIISLSEAQGVLNLETATGVDHPGSAALTLDEKRDSEERIIAAVAQGEQR